MPRLRIPLALLSFLLTATAALAQPAATAPPADEAESAGKLWVKEVAPFLSPDAVLIGRLRLERLTADDGLKNLRQFLDDNIQRPGMSLSKLLDDRAILDGVSEVAFIVQTGRRYDGYVTVTLFRLNGQVPPAKILGSVLGSDQTDEAILTRYSVRKGDWLAITRAPEVTEYLNQQIPFAPTSIADAVDLLEDDPIQLIVQPNANAIFMQGESIPSPAVLYYYAVKLKYAAAGVTFAPQRQIRLAMQLRTAEDAAEIRDWLEVLTTPGNLNHPMAVTIASAFRPYLPKQSTDRITLNLDEADLDKIAELLAPAFAEAQDAALTAEAVNKLKQIALAMHNFHDTFRTFPPGPFPRNDAGRPNLSWRVYLLPFLEQKKLFDQFHFDEPWDSEHNLKLAAQMPECYRAPGVALKDPRLTTYVLPYGKKTIWPGENKSIGFRDIIDGTSNTIMALETTPEAAVIWTKPEDWEFDLQQPFKGLKLDAKGTVKAALVDGSVHRIPKTLDPEMMRRLIERNDGQVVELDE